MHSARIIAHEDLIRATETARQLWTAERARRRSTRREMRPEVRAARSAVRAARRTGDPMVLHRAESEARTVSARRPDPLPLLAAKWSVGCAVSARLGWALCPTWHGPILATGAALASAAVGGWAWSCTVRARTWHGLIPTREERQIMRAVARWHQGAAERGLSEVIPGRARLTRTGVTVHVRLDGRATVGSLRRDLDVVRAHLRIASTRRTEVTAHPRGGWATLTVRTRDAVDTRAARWSAGAAGLGVDVDTGRTVPLPLDARILIGGASGAGKSWALRPLMARALAEGHRVTILDGKGEEGSLWARGTGATVATAAAEVSAALASAGAEMDARGAELSATGATTWRGRLLILAVDEGRVLLGTATPGDLEVLTRIATMGRSRGVVLWWATQHPTVSGRDRGLTAQLAAVMDTRICLRVRSRAHARTVLDDAVDHSPAHEIPRERPGLAYLTGAGTDRQVQVWGMSDDDVRGLRPRADPFAPERATEVAGYVAGYPQDPDTSLCVEPAVTQRAGSPPDPDIARASAPPVWMLRDGGTAADDVLSALASATTPLRQAEIARVTGRPSGTVSRTVRALADSGRIVVGTDGSVQISR